MDFILPRILELEENFFSISGPINMEKALKDIQSADPNQWPDLFLIHYWLPDGQKLHRSSDKNPGSLFFSLYSFMVVSIYLFMLINVS